MQSQKRQNDLCWFPRETIQYHSNPGLCTTLIIESEEELKNLLIKVKEGCEKAGLKLNIQEAEIIASYLITSLQ